MWRKIRFKNFSFFILLSGSRKPNTTFSNLRERLFEIHSKLSRELESFGPTQHLMWIDPKLSKMCALLCWRHALLRFTRRSRAACVHVTISSGSWSFLSKPCAFIRDNALEFILNIISRVYWFLHRFTLVVFVWGFFYIVKADLTGVGDKHERRGVRAELADSHLPGHGGSGAAWSRHAGLGVRVYRLHPAEPDPNSRPNPESARQPGALLDFI